MSQLLVDVFESAGSYNHDSTIYPRLLIESVESFSTDYPFYGHCLGLNAHGVDLPLVIGQSSGVDLRPGELLLDVNCDVYSSGAGGAFLVSFPGWFKQLSRLEDSIEGTYLRPGKKRFDHLVLAHPRYVSSNRCLAWDVLDSGEASLTASTVIGRENLKAIIDFINRFGGRELTIFDVKAKVKGYAINVKDFVLKSNL